jgi:hypothetical protein
MNRNCRPIAAVTSAAIIVMTFAACEPPPKGSKAESIQQGMEAAADKVGAIAEKASNATIAKDLQVVYKAYMDHHDTHNEGAKGWEDIERMVAAKPVNAVSVKRIKDLGYQITWGKKLSSLTEGMSNTVFAQGSGPTMMFDGSIK